jgi:archaeal preflagellin peptidase FlaK
MLTSQMIMYFDTAKIAVSLVVLLYSSWSDHKTRMVSNKVWAVYAPIALLLSAVELVFFAPSNLLFFGVSAGVTIGLAFLLFYTGAFGGADSKAFMCIALALPFTPFSTPDSYTIYSNSIPVLGNYFPILHGAFSPISDLILPFTILTNSVIVAVFSVVYIVIRNIVWHKRNGRKLFEDSLKSESIGKKLAVILTGYKMPVAKLQEKWHIFPLEDVEKQADSEEIKRKLLVIPKDEGRDQIVERLSTSISEGKIKDYIWASPGLPMLIFVTAGLIIALLFGDIMWIVATQLLTLF